MKQCPLFNKCGGCRFDFSSDDYRESKLKLLHGLPITNDPVWIDTGNRRRGDFAFCDGVFGFFERGTKNVIPVRNCPAMTDAVNKILPNVATMPWTGAGSVLITECANGIDIAVTSAVPYFTSEFKKAADKSSAIRITWNGKVVSQTVAPIIRFGDVIVPYPANAFLQPSVAGENALRDLVVCAATIPPTDARNSAVDSPAGGEFIHKKKIADLFCGLGAFTFALNADGFDIDVGDSASVARPGMFTVRDLFKKPLMVQNLKKYDCVVMDPPRAGAMEQSKELAKSDVPRIVYVSCNADTFMRDLEILKRGGYRMTALTPVDQFVGTAHWELVGVFEK